MRGGQESGSREDVDRADVSVVSQGGCRRALNPLPQLVLTIRMQILVPCSIIIKTFKVEALPKLSNVCDAACSRPLENGDSRRDNPELHLVGDTKSGSRGSRLRPYAVRIAG